MAGKQADVSTDVDPAIAAAADADKQHNDDLAAARAEIASLKRTNSELSESERVWAARAQAKEEPEPKRGKDDDADDPDETPEQFVEGLSSGGIKHLEKKGVLTKKVARELIREIATEVAEGIVGKRAAGMMSDARLLKDFPELEDEESELHKETGIVYRRLIKNDPALAKVSGTLAMAAENAKLKLELKGKATGADDAETKRLERVRAQQGDRGRRGATQFDEDDDGALTDFQRDLAKQWGVEEKDVVAEKKKLRARS